MAKIKWNRNGHGGFRPGAGRPRGASSIENPEDEAKRPWSEWDSKSIRALRHRVPKDTSPELAELADYSFSRIVDVMNEKVGFRQARNVLAASALVREEICGPLRKDINIHHTLTYEQLVNESLGEVVKPALAEPIQAAKAEVSATFTSAEIEASIGEGE